MIKTYKHSWILNLIFGLALYFTVLSGCTTPSYIVNSFDFPIAEIQKAISINLPEDLGFVSQNRRTFYSKVFSVPNQKKTKIDVVMKVAILGDRRPYDLSLEIKKVSKIQGDVSDLFDLGEVFEGSESLSKRTVLKIETSLTQRQKDKNLFDDFRPF